MSIIKCVSVNLIESSDSAIHTVMQNVLTSFFFSYERKKKTKNMKFKQGIIEVKY